jgi:predicted branched-subunit amino acid permease
MLWLLGTALQYTGKSLVPLAETQQIRVSFAKTFSTLCAVQFKQSRARKSWTNGDFCYMVSIYLCPNRVAFKSPNLDTVQA